MGFVNKWVGRHVLITGGTGFVGRHVVAQGVNGGAKIFTVSIEQDGLSGVPHYRASVVDSERIRTVIQETRPEAIIHLAAGGVAYGSATLAEMLRINTLGLQTVLEAADALETKPCVVVAGSGFEYAYQDRPLVETDPLAPMSPYGVSKAAATLVAGFYAQRMPITVLRLFSVYGPGERLPRLIPYIIEQTLKGQPVLLTAGEQLRDYTYVEDVAECFWRALALPPDFKGLRVINVASGQPVTLRVVAETLTSILRDHGLAPDIHFGAKPYRHDEPMMYVANINRMIEWLQWRPGTSLREGLRRTVESFLEQDRSGQGDSTRSGD